jgi:hypothetical protein
MRLGLRMGLVESNRDWRHEVDLVRIVVRDISTCESLQVSYAPDEGISPVDHPPCHKVKSRILAEPLSCMDRIAFQFRDRVRFRLQS